MLTVVCWKWTPPRGYRSKFGPETVNTLAAMVRRNYRRPHRFVCVTDDPTGIDRRLSDVIPLWNDFAHLKNPSGASNPSCYRRLRMFSAEAEAVFGKRLVSLDLDCVITGDMAPLWDRPEEFVAWGDTNPTTHYNGSMILLTAGSRRQVWEDFDPVKSPAAAQRAGHFGSDQAWISYCLGGGEATWGTKDGVYSYRLHVRGRPAPRNAKVVFFHGREDPWGAEASRLPWVREHYRIIARSELDIAAVNLGVGVALLNDGRSVPVVQMFDRFGEETSEPAEVASFTAGEGGDWFACDMAKMERMVTQ